MFNEEITQIIDEHDIADLVIDVCATLYNNGIYYIHVGGLMRLLGVSDEQAIEHDTVFFQLDEDFAKRVADMDAIDEAFEAELAKQEDETPPTIH